MTLTKMDIKRIREVNKHLALLEEDSKVLDVSTDERILLQYAPNLKYYAIDKDKDRIRQVRYFTEKAVCKDIDGKKLPFKDEYFDAVIATEILEHLKEPRVLLCEAERVLKNKGLFIGTCPDAFNLIDGLRIQMAKPNYDPFETDHIRFYNIQMLHKELKVWFSKVKTKYLDLLQSKIFWLAKK